MVFLLLYIRLIIFSFESFYFRIKMSFFGESGVISYSNRFFNLLSTCRHASLICIIYRSISAEIAVLLWNEVSFCEKRFLLEKKTTFESLKIIMTQMVLRARKIFWKMEHEKNFARVKYGEKKFYVWIRLTFVWGLRSLW